MRFDDFIGALTLTLPQRIEYFFADSVRDGLIRNAGDETTQLFWGYRCSFDVEAFAVEACREVAHDPVGSNFGLRVAGYLEGAFVITGDFQ